jgi:hypothetical protein
VQLLRLLVCYHSYRTTSYKVGTSNRAQPLYTVTRPLRLAHLKSKPPLFSPASIPALGSAQPHIRWIPEALSPGVKRPDREADHSLPSSA